MNIAEIEGNKDCRRGTNLRFSVVVRWRGGISCVLVCEGHYTTNIELWWGCPVQKLIEMAEKRRNILQLQFCNFT